MKTNIVHFYVQRNSSFGPGGGVIPFQLMKLNVGNAFNLTSGTFTVPVKGIYHFQFSALKSGTATHLDIYLHVNGVTLGLAHTSQSASGSGDTVSLSASLQLEENERVNLYNHRGVLYDDSNHYTHFSGWLMEEELL